MDRFSLHSEKEASKTRNGLWMAALPRQMDSPKHWQQWLGHSENLVDLYAAQLRDDVAYRREWCEGLAWDSIWANWATNWELQF